MTVVRSSPSLVGRDSLVQFTVEVATGAAGAPRAVILVGDPGIGKSALLRNAMAEVMPLSAAMEDMEVGWRLSDEYYETGTSAATRDERWMPTRPAPGTG